MEISLFLAKVFGLYFALMGVVIILHPHWFQKAFNELSENKGMFFIMSFFVLIMGILLVVSHTVFTADWRLLITIISWLILVKGLANLFIPEYSMKMMHQYLKYKSLYYTGGIAFLALGGLLTILGFSYVF